ncbi:MAG TPA: hypothetical protein VGN37_27290 [Actinocatenispora sp.]
MFCPATPRTWFTRADTESNPRPRGYAERFQLAADALEELEHRGPPRFAGESAEWIGAIDFGDAAGAAARIAAEFDGWAPELTALITDADTPPVPRTIHALPDGHVEFFTGALTA